MRSALSRILLRTARALTPAGIWCGGCRRSPDRRKTRVGWDLMLIARVVRDSDPAERLLPSDWGGEADRRVLADNASRCHAS